VAMMVVLLEPGADDFCLRQEAIAALARLGVTNLALARDEQTVAVVLEGWLFDPDRSAAAATSAVGSENATRALQPFMNLAVSAAAHQQEANHAHPHP